MDKSAIIVINEIPHRLSALLALAETLPTVQLFNDAIIDTEHQYQLTQTIAPEELDKHNTPIVFKYENKYRIIAGRNKIKTGNRNVKVMTTVALKKTRLQQQHQ